MSTIATHACVMSMYSNHTRMALLTVQQRCSTVAAYQLSRVWWHERSCLAECSCKVPMVLRTLSAFSKPLLVLACTGDCALQ